MPPNARADDDGDQDLARELHERGDIRALDEIMRVVRERVPGEIVAIELVQLGTKWVYRFQIIASDGRRTGINIDAHAATVIENGGGN